MKKILTIIAFMAVGFWASEAQAQKVIKDGSSIYIDVQDMPSSTWTTSSLDYTHNESSSNNKLYYKFEVDKSNSTKTTWSSAKTNCANKGMRLPTQRELYLMYILRDLLAQAGVTSFTSAEYWSGTEQSSNTSNGSVAIFSNGAIEFLSKNNSYNVRCVREV